MNLWLRMDGRDTNTVWGCLLNYIKIDLDVVKAKFARDNECAIRKAMSNRSLENGRLGMRFEALREKWVELPAVREWVDVVGKKKRWSRPRVTRRLSIGCMGR